MRVFSATARTTPIGNRWLTVASRPVFAPSLSGDLLVLTRHVDFQWFPGMSKTQSQKSIRSLHAEANRQFGLDEILEISSKSADALGVSLSAFNLMIKTVKRGREFSLECAYQASKVFESGGPYIDLMDASSIDAKRDPRLTRSGRLVGFRFFGIDWELEPKTAFYDWLYINALHKQPAIADEVMRYQAFTDIAFNPEKSVNCQAYSAALYASLRGRGLLTADVLKDKFAFLSIVDTNHVSNAREDTSVQSRLI
ncbi:DarT1-associated NADAR antitoxin family protein [Stenotrophomonas maltophilia]|uniref:DarT1-associated NADAR antitoxin family protein n=1 Tax=Stenotrophomonas maltophilia TaxID=40324 RepID=UPI003D18A633